MITVATVGDSPVSVPAPVDHLDPRGFNHEIRTFDTGNLYSHGES